MIEKIYQNKIYKECMDEIVKTSKIDMTSYIESVSIRAMEIAEKLKINTSIIKKAIILTYIGLAIEKEDYIKSSGILAVKILTELEEDEDTIARVLMAIAGQGNEGKSINLFSAVILLANLKEFKNYMKINGLQDEIIKQISLNRLEILYEEKIMKYQLRVENENRELQLIKSQIENIIINCANILQLKVVAEQ